MITFCSGPYLEICSWLQKTGSMLNCVDAKNTKLNGGANFQLIILRPTWGALHFPKFGLKNIRDGS